MTRCNRVATARTPSQTTAIIALSGTGVKPAVGVLVVVVGDKLVIHRGRETRHRGEVVGDLASHFPCVDAIPHQRLCNSDKAKEKTRRGSWLINFDSPNDNHTLQAPRCARER